MKSPHGVGITIFLAALAAGCSSRESVTAETQSPAQRTSESRPAALPSRPKYRGTGTVNDALHVDVSVLRSGEYNVALTDARGDELPASNASNVAIAFKRPTPRANSVSLKIDDSGEKWVGRGPADLDPAATALVTLSYRGESLSASVPLSSVGGPLDYVCPMHPDVRSGTAGMCPRCGMKMVVGLPDRVEYPMDLRIQPATFRSGQKARISFNIRDPKNGTLVKHYEVVHERLFHLFILSSDLKYFVHDHPEINPDGSFHFDEIFPKPGMYRVLADFYPTGGTPQLIPKTVFVPGPPGAPLSIDVAKLSPATGPQRSENTEISLALDPPQPVAGELATLVFRMKPGDGMEKYLGAWAHMLMASDDLIDLVHDHPSTADGSAEMLFYLTFPRARTYRLWIQFQRSGVVNTVAFNIPVARSNVARK